jgi:hypothetical protein
MLFYFSSDVPGFYTLVDCARKLRSRYWFQILDTAKCKEFDPDGRKADGFSWRRLGDWRKGIYT